MPWFAKQGFDCWALSFEGHGKSPNSNGLPPGIDRYVDNLAQALTLLGDPQPIIIAHSMGGFVVQEYLTRHPLHAVALLAPVPASGLSRSTWRMMCQRPDLLTRLNMFQLTGTGMDADSVRALLFSEHSSDKDIEWCLSHCRPESQKALLDMSWSTLAARYSQRPDHALVLLGKSDLLIGDSDVREVVQRLNAKQCNIDELGHMVMLDRQWLLAAKAIHDWLEKEAISTVAADLTPG